jgi:hypothetical protein
VPGGDGTAAGALGVVLDDVKSTAGSADQATDVTWDLLGPSRPVPRSYDQRVLRNPVTSVE